MEDYKNFELYLRREERSENTIACYLRDVRQFFAWYDGESAALTDLTLIAYKRFLNQKEKTVITANRKLASVNAYCRYLYDARRLPEASAVKLTKSRDKPEYKGLEAAELHRLHDGILANGNPMHICIIELLLGTGVRVSELCGLNVRDLNLDPKQPSIRVLGKGMVNRTLPLNRAALNAVVAYLGSRRTEPTQRLLQGQRGPLGRGAVEIILGKYGAALGIEVTPHKLRHSLAYTLIQSGTAMTTIQQILGHESILTTNLYTHTRQQEMATALAGLTW